MTTNAERLLETIKNSPELKSEEAFNVIKRVINASENLTKSVFLGSGNNQPGTPIALAQSSLSAMKSCNSKTQLDKLTDTFNTEGYLFSGCSDHLLPHDDTPTYYVAFNINGYHSFSEEDDVLILEP